MYYTILVRDELQSLLNLASTWEGHPKKKIAKKVKKPLDRYSKSGIIINVKRR